MDTYRLYTVEVGSKIPNNEPIMRAKKSNKIGNLSGNKNHLVDDFEILLVSVLSNILASRALGLPTSKASDKFMSAVKKSYAKCYQDNFKALEAWKKRFCVERLIDAYRVKGRDRRMAVEQVIRFVDGWKLNRRKLTEQQRKNLFEVEDETSFISRKTSPQELALLKINRMLEYSQSSYFRDKRMGKNLDALVSKHFGNELDIKKSLAITLNYVFGVKKEIIPEVLNLIMKRDPSWATDELPFHSGKAAWAFGNRINK